MIKQKGFTEQLIVYQMILYNKYNKAGYWLKNGFFWSITIQEQLEDFPSTCLGRKFSIKVRETYAI